MFDRCSWSTSSLHLNLVFLFLKFEVLGHSVFLIFGTLRVEHEADGAFFRAQFGGASGWRSDVFREVILRAGHGCVVVLDSWILDAVTCCGSVLVLILLLGAHGVASKVLSGSFLV